MKAKTSKKEMTAASLDHVWTNGYHNTSIKDVIERAGILKGSFYNYFDSKDQFIGAVLHRYTEGWARMVSGSLNDTSQTPKQRLRNLFAAYREMYQGDMLSKGCLAGNIGQEMGGIHPVLSAQVETSFARVEAMYRSCLEDALQEKQISPETDTGKAASFLINGLQGVLMRMKTVQTVGPLDDFEEMIFTMLFEN